MALVLLGLVPNLVKHNLIFALCPSKLLFLVVGHLASAQFNHISAPLTLVGNIILSRLN